MTLPTWQPPPASPPAAPGPPVTIWGYTPQLFYSPQELDQFLSADTMDQPSYASREEMWQDKAHQTKYPMNRSFSTHTNPSPNMWLFQGEAQAMTDFEEALEFGHVPDIHDPATGKIDGRRVLEKHGFDSLDDFIEAGKLDEILPPSTGKDTWYHAFRNEPFHEPIGVETDYSKPVDRFLNDVDAGYYGLDVGATAADPIDVGGARIGDGHHRLAANLEPGGKPWLYPDYAVEHQNYVPGSQPGARRRKRNMMPVTGDIAWPGFGPTDEYLNHPRVRVVLNDPPLHPGPLPPELAGRAPRREVRGQRPLFITDAADQIRETWRDAPEPRRRLNQSGRVRPAAGAITGLSALAGLLAPLAIQKFNEWTR